MMTRSPCYYEILGVSETATGDEIKKAYKAQALVWHPDKNQANPDEAHAKFQAILKAYETLSDVRERDWYDRHKDQILSGDQKNGSGETINLFQYFSSSCYAKFDDSEDGFYTIYRGVFEKLAEEEEQAIEQSTKLLRGKNKSKLDKKSDSLPTFGKSDSDYDEVVKPFYAFWSSFCTQLTFDQLDKYNTTEAENRRILRLMEKENKKVKDAAKKERSNTVRNLVEFIKKRDKRLRAHRLLVEQQNELNRQKTLEKQRQQREKFQKESTDYKPSVWLDMNDVEQQLQQLEDEYEELDLKKGRKSKNNRRFRQDNTSDDQISETVANGSEDILESVGTTDPAVHSKGDKLATDKNSGRCSDDSVEVSDDEYFCPACNKDFRSINAFENHETSKKHKQNVQTLKRLLEADESKLK